MTIHTILLLHNTCPSSVSLPLGSLSHWMTSFSAPHSLGVQHTPATVDCIIGTIDFIVISIVNRKVDMVLIIRYIQYQLPEFPK